MANTPPRSIDIIGSELIVAARDLQRANERYAIVAAESNKLNEQINQLDHKYKMLMRELDMSFKAKAEFEAGYMR